MRNVRYDNLESVIVFFDHINIHFATNIKSLCQLQAYKYRKNRFSVKHIYSTKRENIDQQGYALYKDLCNETYIQ